MRCVLIAQAFSLTKRARCIENTGSALFEQVEATIEDRKPMAVGLGKYANPANIC